MLKHLPGVLACAALASLALVISTLPFAPFTMNGRHPVDSILIAIVLGILVRTFLAPPAWLASGTKFSAKKLLPFAIVLLGAKLNFVDILSVSANALWINVTCVGVAIFLTLWICKRAGVAQKLRILIAVGTGICGGTAIVVSAPVIEASDEDTAFAVTAVTLFGLLSIIVFPLIGTALAMDQASFGVWAGTAVHATPQVIAAGYTYGELAGDIATLVKLVRVLLLAPVVIGLGVWMAREKRKTSEVHVRKRLAFQTLVPTFIIGFILVAVANSLNLLPDFTLHLQESVFWNTSDVRVSTAALAREVSSFLIMMAMAAIGLGVDARGLLRSGMKAIRVGLIATVILAGFSLGLITLFL